VLRRGRSAPNDPRHSELTRIVRVRSVSLLKRLEADKLDNRQLPWAKKKDSEGPILRQEYRYSSGAND